MTDKPIVHVDPLADIIPPGYERNEDGELVAIDPHIKPPSEY